MKCILIALLLVAVATAQYGKGPSPSPTQAKAASPSWLAGAVGAENDNSADKTPGQGPHASPVLPPSCNLTPLSQSICESLATQFGGTGGTSAFIAARQVFMQFCQNPVAVPDVETCLNQRCPVGMPAAAGHTPQQTFDACRAGRPGFDTNGQVNLCARHTCTPKAPSVPAQPTCQLQAPFNPDCATFAQNACSGGVTTTFQICRTVVGQLCQQPQAFPDAATCIANQCASLIGPDASHPTDVVRAVCSGTFNTANVAKSELQFFPTGVPATIAGVSGLCAQLTCPAPPAPPAPLTTTVVLQTPFTTFPPLPALLAAFQANQAKGTSPSVRVAPPVAPVAPPALPAVPVAPAPCAPAPAPERVIFVATDDDCVDNLQDEVDKLRSVVETLKVLLVSKKVPVPQDCRTPPVFPPPTVTPPGPPRTILTPPGPPGTILTPPGPPGTILTPPTPNGPPRSITNGKPPGPGGSVPKTPSHGPSHSTPGKTPGGSVPKHGKPPGPGGSVPKTPSHGPSHSTPGKTPGGSVPKTPGHGPSHSTPGKSVPKTPGHSTTNGKPPANKSVKISSSGGISSVAVVGMVIGSAAAAGCAAVAIGLFASGAGATGAAPVSAAGMPHAAHNPLYQAHTSGGDNALFGH